MLPGLINLLCLFDFEFFFNDLYVIMCFLICVIAVNQELFMQHLMTIFLYLSARSSLLWHSVIL